MKIGFSIEAPAFKENIELLMGGCESFDEFLNELKVAGVDSIEIRKLSRKVNPTTYEAYNKSIQKIWDSGMEITVHGDLNGDFSGETFRDVYPSMTYILDNYHKYQNKLVVTLHAFQEEKTELNSSATELKESTILILKDWINKVTNENLNVYFALENNRNKESTIDPGNSCKAVVEMVESVNHPNLGICWDMGHLYSNLLFDSELELKLGDTPPNEFVEKVYHTHIHGLNVEGITHFPLTKEYRLPIETYVKALKEAGYDGVYNLELTFDRFPKDTSNIDEALNSVKYLKSQS